MCSPAFARRAGCGVSAQIVTLLFTDLVGSSALLERLGDDAGERMRRTHFGLLHDAVADAVANIRDANVGKVVCPEGERTATSRRDLTDRQPANLCGGHRIADEVLTAPESRSVRTPPNPNARTSVGTSRNRFDSIVHRSKRSRRPTTAPTSTEASSLPGTGVEIGAKRWSRSSTSPS
jgi:hypothetical protein